MKYLVFTIALLVSGLANASSPVCGTSSAPDSMDGTLVEKACLGDQLVLQLRSGEQKEYEVIDFNPEDGEGVNTLTLASNDGTTFSLQLITDDEGNYLQLRPLRDEPIPFNRIFVIHF